MSYAYIGKDGKFEGNFVLTDSNGKFIFGKYDYSISQKSLAVKIYHTSMFTSGDSVRIVFLEKNSFSEEELQERLAQLKTAYNIILPIVQMEKY